MNKLSLLVLASLGAAMPSALLAACATDNGDSVHGPQFGPPPERPEGGGAEGSVTEGGGPGPDGSTGGDAEADGSMPPACTSGTVAVLAGTNSTLSGAVQMNGGAWSGAAIAGGAALSTPSLLAFGTGFVGLTRGPLDALQSVSYTASWSGVTAVGSLKTLGTPALAALGANAQAVYLSGSAADSNKFSRIQNSATSWTTTGDPVTPPMGMQSFGPSAGAIAAAGTDLRLRPGRRQRGALRPEMGRRRVVGRCPDRRCGYEQGRSAGARVGPWQVRHHPSLRRQHREPRHRLRDP